MTKVLSLFFFLIIFISSCKKKEGTTTPIAPAFFELKTVQVNGVFGGNSYTNLNTLPFIKISFAVKLDRTAVANAIGFKTQSGVSVAFTQQYENNDSTLVISPTLNLSFLTKYNLTINSSLKSQSGTSLSSNAVVSLFTSIDSSQKFPTFTDNQLLDKVQQQTLKYFYDFAHPVSGLARERNNSGDLVTTGGSGFGIMALLVGINRNFITRAQGLALLQKQTLFLKNTAQTFHGAYPHWVNGITGAVMNFSANDNGADLVETSFLMQGLLCARQFFSGNDVAETALRNDINIIYNRVEWNWFRQGGQNVLYWHWSPTVGWQINQKIEGWNECLITYVLAASSPSFSIPPIVYTQGFARNGSMVNGAVFYGYTLPLGQNLGGPLFFSHYSFLGINPNGLVDIYANYQNQTKNHSLINYNYCKANPKGWYGYSDAVWGLTASDIPNNEYTASSPTNDVGVIAPTAALSSMPYTPTESMRALKFYYYILGDKIFKEYGFVDAFKLEEPWFANSFLAIDQGPIIVNIENFRSGLIWNLFTSCPEVKSGMLSLGFTAPYL